MSRGKAEAVRGHFQEQIDRTKGILDGMDFMHKTVEEGPDPKRNWRNHITGWCIVSKERVNAHQQAFALQWVRGSGPPRVKVGCQYKTLPQAWRVVKNRGRRGYSRHARAQAECIIRLLLLKAQFAGLPGVKNLKFDGSLSKR